jgi:serine/threonine protein kinase
MIPADDDLPDDDPRILQASREYLAELEAGRTPDRGAYQSRFPDLAEALSECFDGIDLAQSLRPLSTAATYAPEFTASPLGDFQIVREIGRGGMGVVYEAVQLSLGRRVALKVLPFASALDAKHLQRFKTEAQSAAQLHHTNIVPVYAVGCDRGVHFYAMQLINGRSLADAIDELRHTGTTESLPNLHGRSTVDATGQATRLQAGPSRTQHSAQSRAAFRTAARMAAQVADALDYAHEAGIVHRDIKPANILLDARGNVWVTDFGLAQVNADVTLTQSGDLVGTLRYMSPEQAGGKRTLVDHRTDVYSLGATLYELLTLKPVFPATDRVSLFHQILNEEPRPLRQWDRTIPVELETIVLKALAKNPGERYVSAGEMAADLRRFLEERPILARRPTLVDRGRKWLRRHPSMVVAAILVLACGTVGLAITTAIVSHEHAETKDAYQRESQRATEAQERFQLARRAADEMIQLAEEELADNPFQERLRHRLLEAALVYYQEFIRQRDGDPGAQAELAQTRDRVKKILADLALLKADRDNFLLNAPTVLGDLQVSDEQRSRLEEWLLKANEQRDSLWRRGPRSIEREQRILEIARTNESVLSSILNTDQFKRLRQIALQVQGPAAFREPAVANELKLTADQKERIREIDAEAFGPPPDDRKDRGPPPLRKDRKEPERPPPMFDAQRIKAATERIEALLTADQRTTWQTMIGRPFEGPLFVHFREDHPGPPRERPPK